MFSSACAAPGATTPKWWVQRRPCTPAAARRGATWCTPVRCSSLSEGSPQPAIRRSANYQPNSWDYSYMESLAADNKGDRSLGDPSSFDKLKFCIRHVLLQEVDLLPKLTVIDTVQRLGVAYHFDHQISAILSNVSMEGQDIDHVENVHLMTLSFRLLRQNNYPVSPEVLLRGLKDGRGNFKKTLHKDIEGLLSLYEASHLAFEGEYLLDEARMFSTEALRELSPSMHPHLRYAVDNALAVPQYWAAPRLQARWFINHYARESQVDLLLLHFAKLEFNNVQKLQQQEISRIAGWWRNINLSESLPFARDRLMECYHCATGLAPEPSLEACREVLAKTIALTTLLDDIYDIYGTLDELVMFTDAIERWEAPTSEQLPDYMKAIYVAIISTSNEVAEHVLRQHGCDAKFLLKKAWHDFCKASLLQAKWHYSNYKPTLHEYLENGWISVGGPLFLIHAVLMIETQGVTTNSIQQLESYPKLVQMVSKIFRLCNDCATHSEELKRGEAPSSIAIYMSENRATEHDARKAMRDLTMETWKMVNQDVFSNCQFTLSFANACVNLARVSHCTYHGGDTIGAPDDARRLEIEELFLEPFNVEN